MTSTMHYTVSGMTCAHCVNAVTDEVSAVAGVREVSVDLATGALLVTSDQQISRARIEQAVDEAGYALVHG